MNTTPIIEVNRLIALIAKGNRNTLLLFLASHGLKSMIEVFGTIEAFNSAVGPLYNRNNLPNQIKKIMASNLVMEGGLDNDMITPYSELIEKFIGV